MSENQDSGDTQTLHLDEGELNLLWTIIISHEDAGLDDEDFDSLSQKVARLRRQADMDSSHD